jgi:hypothetical protein
MTDIDERARQMSDDERATYLEEHGWEFCGAGWFPPGWTEEHTPGGGAIRTNLTGGGMYSKSAAVREQLARETPGAVPNELGRYYHGPAPANSSGVGGDVVRL